MYKLLELISLMFILYSGNPFKSHLSTIKLQLLLLFENIKIQVSTVASLKVCLGVFFVRKQQCEF